MKKIIIAAALILVSIVTAYSLTSAQKSGSAASKVENIDFNIQSSSSAPRSDIGTAD